MNKAELIEIISVKTDTNNLKAKHIIDTFCETIISEVKRGNRIQLNGFGTFERRLRKEKKGRNPQTGERLVIPEHIVPFFKPSKEFKK